MSSMLASNNPGLCPVKGQKSGLCSWTRACNTIRACLWVLIKTRHITMCWLSIQHFWEYSWYIPAARSTKWATRCKILEVKWNIFTGHIAAVYPTTRCAQSWYVLATFSDLNNFINILLFFLHSNDYQRNLTCKYVLFDFQNFTSGDSFHWPFCWNVSIVLPEDGPFRVEKYWVTHNVNNTVVFQ